MPVLKVQKNYLKYLLHLITLFMLTVYQLKGLQELLDLFEIPIVTEFDPSFEKFDFIIDAIFGKILLTMQSTLLSFQLFEMLILDNRFQL